MGPLTLLVLWLHVALSGEQWRLLHQDGGVESLWGTPELQPEQRAQLISAWVWSARRIPRRVAPPAIGRVRFNEDGGRLAVRVARRAAGKPPADLRLLAAPSEMWREIPESALPSWPIPPSGRLSIPVDSGHPWRLRVAGTGEGSWWTDVRPGQRSASLVTAAAAGIQVTILDPRGKPTTAVNGFLQEAEGRGGSLRHWANLRTEAGKFAAPGLPDEAEVSLTVLSPGTAPVALRGRPSVLPRLVRLAAGAELVGRLVDRGGAPVRAASVAAEAWTATDLPRTFTVRSKTGSDGRWRLRGLPAGKVVWTARAAGFVPLSEPLDVQAGLLEDLGTRALERGTALAVRVLDDAGAPVPEAKVQDSSGLIEATTDASGVAHLAGLAAAPVEIKASAPRHLSADAHFSPPFPAAPQLLLSRAFLIVGRFVDASGAPVLRGSVRVDSGTCQRDERLREGGRFELDLPPDGQAAELVLRSPETQELRLPLPPGHAGEIRDLGDVQAPAGLAVRGQVVRAEDHSPVAGARVWTTRQGPEGPAVAWAARDLLETTSREDGRFELSGLLPTPALLRIEAAGFARSQLDLPLPAPDRDAPRAAIDLGTIILSAGATLHVHVDTTGTEAQGATARADLGNRWLEPDLLTAQVWDGEATLPNVPAGNVTVSVVSGRRLLCEQAVLVEDGAEQDVDCRRPALRVSGLVQIGAHTASSGALLWQMPTDTQSRIDTVVSPAGLRQTKLVGTGRPQVEVPVGPDGRFQSDELVPGTWTVGWSAEGAAGGTITVRIPEVERFDTVLPFPGTAVTGIVVDRDGQPVAGARVRELRSGALTFSQADGSFSLLGLKDGQVVVQAQLQEQTSQAAEVILRDESAEPLRLVLGARKAPAVTVLVTDRDGLPIPGAFVFLAEEGKGYRLLTTAGDGRAKATLDPPLPPRVRAAAFASGIWGFGNWASWETAQDGIAVALSGTGSLVVRSPKHHGSPTITTEDGWDLSWMLRLLGVPPTLSVEQPLLLTGLPPGQYTLVLADTSVTVHVDTTRPGEASIE